MMYRFQSLLSSARCGTTSRAFNVFTMATKGYNYMRALIFGQAQYIGTERGYVLQNASMVRRCSTPTE